jgi:hypothetical protein
MPGSGTVIQRAKPAQGRLSKLAEANGTVKRVGVELLGEADLRAEPTLQVQKIAFL